jgi:hypothetical protein
VDHLYIIREDKVRQARMSFAKFQNILEIMFKSILAETLKKSSCQVLPPIQGAVGCYFRFFFRNGTTLG